MDADSPGDPQDSDAVEHKHHYVPPPVDLSYRVAVRTVLWVIMGSMFLGFVVIMLVMGTPWRQLSLLLSGLILLPVLSMVPCANGEAVPFSQPSEEAKSAGRGLHMLVVTFVSMGVAGVAALADTFGFLWFFLIGETIVAAIVYAILQHRCAKARWPAID